MKRVAGRRRRAHDAQYTIPLLLPASPKDLYEVKLRYELHHARIVDDGRRVVDAEIRVRGLDARFGRRGFVVERQEPVAVVVRTPKGMHREVLPRPRTFRTLSFALAGPALFLAVRQTLKKGRG